MPALAAMRGNEIDQVLQEQAVGGPMENRQVQDRFAVASSDLAAACISRPGEYACKSEGSRLRFS